MTVAQYEAKFAELSRYAPHQVAIEEDRVMLFENGLRPKIYAKVAISEMKTYSALVSKALLAEKGAEEEKRAEEQKAKEPQNKRLREERQVEHRGGGSNPSKKPYTQGQVSNGMRQQNRRICDICGRSHSVEYNCDGTGRICFKCGKPGHLSAQCRSKGLGGSTHSFAAPKFLRCLSIPCEPLDACVAVFTPLGETVVLGDGDGKGSSICFISSLQANRILRKGCHGYLACVVSTEQLEQKLEELPVVREFVDVFLEDLPNLPSNREVEFSIDLVSNTTLISKAPYRMAPLELRDLQTQL
ncbi:uncharacterized protein LOC114256318 [Camellia sinensis]|uniref:uncharacterized protein LOC114256318 n=1 Tax=Camellia sinensis TaxID=4442 RepID=UPI0010363732|nr:uncharacterized protein LOC114256318 [Camellia sinensis]